MRSILPDFKRSKTMVLKILETLNFDFWKNVTLENVKSTQKFEIQTYSNEQNCSFFYSNLPNLILGNVKVVEKF